MEYVLMGQPLNGRSGHEAGRQLLEACWRETVGTSLPEIAVTPRGKPYFPDRQWHFSISHTKGHVFCALARQNIGIDAEELDRDIRPELAEKILSPAEYARWEACGDRRLALLKLWVLKEAAAKHSGLGLQGYPNHTDFSPEDPRILCREGCLVAVIL